MVLPGCLFVCLLVLLLMCFLFNNKCSFLYCKKLYMHYVHAYFVPNKTIFVKVHEL